MQARRRYKRSLYTVGLVPESVSCLSALTGNNQTLQIPYRNPTKALLFTHRTPTAYLLHTYGIPTEYLRNTYKMDYKTDGR